MYTNVPFKLHAAHRTSAQAGRLPKHRVGFGRDTFLNIGLRFKSVPARQPYQPEQINSGERDGGEKPRAQHWSI